MLLNDAATTFDPHEHSRVLRLFVVCGVPNPDPSNNWSQKNVEVWTEHGCIEKLDLSVVEFQFL